MRGISRFVAVFSVLVLLFSSSFAGIWTASESLGSFIAQQLRGRPGHFTDRPTSAKLGSHPGKTKNRGGMWSKSALEHAKRAQGLIASFTPFPWFLHTTPISADPGSSMPWEGSFGGVNSGNGNKLTSLNLFSWKTRGGMSVDFTLYHNSQTSYNDELGHGWTWTYDSYVVEDLFTGDAVVHHGNATCIPYT